MTRGSGLGYSSLSVDDSKFIVGRGVAMLELCSGVYHGSVLAACSEGAHISGKVAKSVGNTAPVMLCLRYSPIAILIL